VESISGNSRTLSKIRLLVPSGGSYKKIERGVGQNGSGSLKNNIRLREQVIGTTLGSGKNKIDHAEM
jgi:hypothetical protein